MDWPCRCDDGRRPHRRASTSSPTARTWWSTGGTQSSRQPMRYRRSSAEDANGKRSGTHMTAWDTEVDVVVLGTGGAGLTAALTALVNGASVAVYEKSASVGGTTA